MEMSDATKIKRLRALAATLSLYKELTCSEISGLEEVMKVAVMGDSMSLHKIVPEWNVVKTGLGGNINGVLSLQNMLFGMMDIIIAESSEKAAVLKGTGANARYYFGEDSIACNKDNALQVSSCLSGNIFKEKFDFVFENVVRFIKKFGTNSKGMSDRWGIIRQALSTINVTQQLLKTQGKLDDYESLSEDSMSTCSSMTDANYSNKQGVEKLQACIVKLEDEESILNLLETLYMYLENPHGVGSTRMVQMLEDTTGETTLAGIDSFVKITEKAMTLIRNFNSTELSTWCLAEIYWLADKSLVAKYQNLKNSYANLFVNCFASTCSFMVQHKTTTPIKVSVMHLRKGDMLVAMKLDDYNRWDKGANPKWRSLEVTDARKVDKQQFSGDLLQHKRSAETVVTKEHILDSEDWVKYHTIGPVERYVVEFKCEGSMTEVVVLGTDKSDPIFVKINAEIEDKNICFKTEDKTDKIGSKTTEYKIPDKKYARYYFSQATIMINCLRNNDSYGWDNEKYDYHFSLEAVRTLAKDDVVRDNITSLDKLFSGPKEKLDNESLSKLYKFSEGVLNNLTNLG